MTANTKALGRIGRYRELIVALTELAGEFKSADLTEDAGFDIQRRALEEILVAILIYLKPDPAYSAVRQPLLALAGALSDARDGIKSPLFAIKGHKGNVLPGDRAALLTGASVAVSLLMQDGDSENAAANYVAARCGSVGIRLDAGRAATDAQAARSLQGWRDKLLSGRKPKEWQDRYWTGFNKLKGPRGKHAADAMINNLIERFGKKLPG